MTATLAERDEVTGRARRPRAAGDGLERALLVSIVVLGASLALAWSVRKGLVLDEFHSLFHARNAGTAHFFEELRRDNHPPAFFLLLGLVRATLGEAELALRAPSIVFGSLSVVLVWGLARGGGLARAAIAAQLLALSTLELEFASQARMYALHASCTTAVVAGLLAAEDGRRSRRGPPALVFAATLVGLHTHYFFLYYLAAIVAGAGLGILVSKARPSRERVRACALAIAAAAVCALPWYLWGFRVQLAHGLPPGMTAAGPDRIAEALVHLLYLNIRVAGPVPRILFVACGGIAIALGLWGLAAGRREDRLERCVLGAVAFGVPVGAGVLAGLHPRFGFNWSYVLPSAAAFVVLIARAESAGPLRAARRAAIAIVGLAALALALLNVRAGGTERYREAIASLCRASRPQDAVIPVEWQPAVFEQGLAWDYYAPRMKELGLSAPERLRVDEHWRLPDLRVLDAHPRVFVLRRSLPANAPLLESLRERYPLEATEEWGFGLWVDTYTR